MLISGGAIELKMENISSGCGVKVTVVEYLGGVGAGMDEVCGSVAYLGADAKCWTPYGESSADPEPTRLPVRS